MSSFSGSHPPLFLAAALLFYLAYVAISGTTHQYGDASTRPVLVWDGKTLAEVFMDDTETMRHCRLHELEDVSDGEAIVNGSGLSVRRPPFKEMLQLVEECTRLEKPPSNTTAPPPDTNATWPISWPIWNGILPGTKWCGVGDIAESFEQLGAETELDACCRAHDHCPVKIKAFRAEYGIINLALYTKSHCDCDRLFFSCLKNTRNRVADMVGNFYFNIMKAQCIQEHPVYICAVNATNHDSKACTEWVEDSNSKKMHAVSIQLKY